MLINTNPDTDEKLAILSHDSRYDLACACAKREEEHRTRSKDNKWIYPKNWDYPAFTSALIREELVRQTFPENIPSRPMTNF